MKLHTTLPLASLSLIILFAVVLMRPLPSIEQRVRLQVPVADQAPSCGRFHPSIVVNVKPNGKMLDFNGRPMTRSTLRAALEKFAKTPQSPYFVQPTVSIRADRNSPVGAVRLIYDEAVNAGYAKMNFRVCTSDRGRF